jgi:hypothetical protein
MLLLKHSSRSGQFSKTFQGLLLGMTGWYSNKCFLTWRIVDTKYKRLYFQLQASTLPIGEIDSGLLPTSRARDGKFLQDRKLTLKDGKMQNLDKNGVAYGMTLNQAVSLLPTPTGQEVPHLKANLTKTNRRLSRNKKSSHSLNLIDRLLPTPSVMDALMEGIPERKGSNMKEGGRHGVSPHHLSSAGLLPTPREAASRGNCSRDRGKGNLEDEIAKSMLLTPTVQDSNKASKRMRKDHQNNLTAIVFDKMIPTPASRDHKGARSLEALEDAERGETNSLPDFFAQTGKSSQLNPLFVEAMMGYPNSWVLLPFLNGEKKV